MPVGNFLTSLAENYNLGGIQIFCIRKILMILTWIPPFQRNGIGISYASTLRYFSVKRIRTYIFLKDIHVNQFVFFNGLKNFPILVKKLFLNILKFDF